MASTCDKSNMSEFLQEEALTAASAGIQLHLKADELRKCCMNPNVLTKNFLNGLADTKEAEALKMGQYGNDLHKLHIYVVEAYDPVSALLKLLDQPEFAEAARKKLLEN
jgi:hypothetical protein